MLPSHDREQVEHLIPHLRPLRDEKGLKKANRAVALRIANSMGRHVAAWLFGVPPRMIQRWQWKHDLDNRSDTNLL